ncbi:MAG: hypothetical protein QXG03_00455 [Halalkalicoccus sp.]
MVSTHTAITAAFVVLAVALWYGVSQTTDSTVVPLVVLLGVGVVVPLGINAWRAQNG